MIELARGNILEADAEALVNTVNCVGFMGKGIALQFKKAQQGLPESHEGRHDLDVDLDRSIQGHRAGFLNPIPVRLCAPDSAACMEINYIIFNLLSTPALRFDRLGKLFQAIDPVLRVSTNLVHESAGDPTGRLQALLPVLDGSTLLAGWRQGSGLRQAVWGGNRAAVWWFRKQWHTPSCPRMTVRFPPRFPRPACVVKGQEIRETIPAHVA
jgi:hypothetical protein